ncbi:hypothetical protein J6590_026962 [Homalodisca vitripennis]|nr:hypothetical protein J6590_026962 [Homalodisca vitripennis]
MSGYFLREDFADSSLIKIHWLNVRNLIRIPNRIESSTMQERIAAGDYCIPCKSAQLSESMRSCRGRGGGGTHVPPRQCPYRRPYLRSAAELLCLCLPKSAQIAINHRLFGVPLVPISLRPLGSLTSSCAAAAAAVHEFFRNTCNFFYRPAESCPPPVMSKFSPPRLLFDDLKFFKSRSTTFTRRFHI